MMTAPKIDIDSFWLPKATSTLAGQVDSAWNIVLYTSHRLLLCILIGADWLLPHEVPA